MIERVKLLMSVKNLSSAQLAEIIGVQRSGISHILSGRNKPSLDFVLKVMEAYPDLNESWLLTGAGEMLKREKQKDAFVVKDELRDEDQVNPIIMESLLMKSEAMPHDEADEKLDDPDKLESDKVITETPIDIRKDTASDDVVIETNRNKKLIKLIAIYSDDSFKIYHSE